MPRFHLSTALMLCLTAGAILGANIWGQVFAKDSDGALLVYGWPWWSGSSLTARPDFHYSIWTRVLMNAGFGLFALAFVFLLLERFTEGAVKSWGLRLHPLTSISIVISGGAVLWANTVYRGVKQNYSILEYGLGWPLECCHGQWYFVFLPNWNPGAIALNAMIGLTITLAAGAVVECAVRLVRKRSASPAEK